METFLAQGRKPDVSECVIIRDPRGLRGDAYQDVSRKFSVKGMDATLQSIFSELKDGSLNLGDWKKGEIEITGIVGMIANRFWVEVEYAVLFPPKKGTEPVAGSYRVIVWTSGVEAGAGALLFTPAWEVVLVRQFRHAPRRWTLEIPRGARMPGESFRDCAMRESTEEVGAMFGRNSRIEEVGLVTPDSGVLRQNVGLIVATNVVVDESRQHRDTSESHLGIITVPIPTFLAMVDRDEVTCGITLTAFTKAVARGIVPGHLLVPQTTD